MKQYKSKKTKTQLEINVKSILFYITLIIGASLIVAPLVHKVLPSTNYAVESYKQELSTKIKPIDESIMLLRQSYKNNEITAEDFITKNDKLVELKNSLLETNKKLLNQKKEDSRIFGWLTWKRFGAGFGVRLPYLLFSLLISWLISKINTRSNKNLKNTFLYIQITCYTSAFYQLIWCFWYSQDYPLKAYLWFAIALCMFLSVLFVYFINYRELFKHKFELKIKTLFTFIYSLNTKNVIKEEKEEEFAISRIEVTDEVILEK